MDAASWERAKDLIADAMNLAPAERDAFLEAHCSDPALLVEIRNLIRSYEDTPGFLEKPAGIRESDTLQPGSHVGPYVIIRRLGAGGMGQVFLSNDDRLERKVALKRLIPSQLDRSIERSRILSEARSAARISHPNVAAVHDVLDHDGRIFIVMEFVEGESLAVRLRREWLPLDRVLVIGRQLAAALAAAHAQGVVHRDLKPSNIQITLDGSVKVLDFGIATASTPVTKLTTSTGSVIRSVGVARGAAGTPEYMSPEQVQGQVVDQRSDIFSLGLVLFEMVTGRRAFADMGLADRRAAPMMRVPRADALDPRVPREVADVIAKAVTVDVTDRFQSAAELGQALEELERLRGGWKRRSLRSLTAVAAAVLVFGTVGFLSAAAFNLTLQRPARFAPEALSSYLVVGARANGMLMTTAVLITIAIFGFLFLVRLACLLEPCRRARARLRRVADRAVSTLGLADPTLLAQCLAVAGLVAMLAMWWRFGDLISAYFRRVSLTPAEALLPLAPGNVREFFFYRLSVNLLLLSFAAGLLRIIRLRARMRTRQDYGAIAIAATIFAMIAVMHVFPYRIIYQNEFERVEFGGARCYLIGQDANEGLIYCPDVTPPRNRVIATNAPDLHRSGVFESVFTPADRTPSGDGAAPQTR